MNERIQELSDDQIDRLAALGKDVLTSLSPPIAYLVYGDSPDQLQALRNLGPSTLRIVSPQLADMLYGDDGSKIDFPPLHPGTIPEPIDHPPDYWRDNRLRWPLQPRPIPGEYNIWSTTGFGCELCQSNEDVGVVRYGDAFPSGHTAPPAHNGCRCILDAVDNVQGIDDVEHIYTSGYQDRIF